MLAVTKEIIKNFNLRDIGYDFMGYSFEETKELTFHHLLLPRKVCEDSNLGKGYEDCNGVILVRTTSHNYIHVIEEYDSNLFYEITSEMLDQKIKGRLDKKNIYYIHLLLKQFEEEYEGMKGRKNEQLIKSEYQKRLFNNGRWISEKYYIVN